MKTKIYALLLTALLSTPCLQAGDMEKSLASDTPDTTDTTVLKRRISIGVLAGTDIGGAVPYPFKHIPDKFNPYPQLSIALGAKVNIPLKGKKWGLGAEVTYKRVALEADARVENQRFEGMDQGVKKTQYFSGTAAMSMAFNMIEVPLYVRYAFTSGQGSHLLFGVYGAYYLNSRFNVTATKGYVGNEPDEFRNAVTPEAPIHMDFSSSMDSWDAGLLLGYEKKLFSRFDIGLRVTFGLKDIFTADNKYFDYKMLQMRGTLTLSYDLFVLRTRDK